MAWLRRTAIAGAVLATAATVVTAHSGNETRAQRVANQLTAGVFEPDGPDIKACRAAIDKLDNRRRIPEASAGSGAARRTCAAIATSRAPDPGKAKREACSLALAQLEKGESPMAVTDGSGCTLSVGPA